jgi:hypothetical protein
LLEQLSQPLAASPRQLSRGQPPSRDRGAGLDKGIHVDVLGERLGDRISLCSDVGGVFLTLHVRSLQPILDLTRVMVYEYNRNHARGQQERERTQEKKRGVHSPQSRTWVVVRDMSYTKRLILKCCSNEAMEPLSAA